MRGVGPCAALAAAMVLSAVVVADGGAAGAADAADAVAPAPSRGARLELRQARVQSRDLAELARHLAQRGPLQELVDGIGGRLKLPRSIGLRHAECGEVNAYYVPEVREVIVCLELIERLAEDFGARLDSDADLAEAVAGATRFVALHELGHALVDVLDLPVTGREEDAVDQLSTWLLIREPHGSDSVLSAAAAFGLFGDDRGLRSEDVAGPHSLDHQRYFNMVCWVYGSDPEAHADLLAQGALPAARADGCAAEFARLDRSWRVLMRPHLKTSEQAGGR